MTLDLSTEYKVFDEGDTGSSLCSITLTRRDVLHWETPITITNAIFLDVTQTEAEISDGIYQNHDVYCEIPFNSIIIPINPVVRPPDVYYSPSGYYVPQLGDLITGAAPFHQIDYVITSIRQPFCKDYWGLQCRSPQLVSNLTDTADYYKAYYNGHTTDIYGDKITDQQPNTLGIKCRLQPKTATLRDELGKRGFYTDFTIYMNQQMDLEYGDLFIISNTKYRVVSFNNKKGLAKLTEINVEIQP